MCFDENYNRIKYNTWEEFYTANKDRKVETLDICCNEGFKWVKNHDDGTFIYNNWSGDETVFISDGNSAIITEYNPMYEDTSDTQVRLSVNNNIVNMLNGINATPTPTTPPKPDKPKTLKTYPEEVLENVYIDDWSFKYNYKTGEEFKSVEKYDRVKDFLDKSLGLNKKNLTLQAQTGFNFSLDESDGYIKFFNGEKYTFKYMWDNGELVGDKEPYTKPDDHRKLTYPEARKFTFLKGEEFSDGVDEYIVIRKYDKETIDIDLLGYNRGYSLIEMNEGASYDGTPPFDGINWNRIAEISAHALVTTEKPLKNDAFTTYILSGEQMLYLREQGAVYNDMIINTYNYPIPFNPDSLIEKDMKIETADTNIPVKEFKKITNEIPIFEFTIPELPDVNLVTVFPIFKEGVTLSYETIRGKVVKGVSVYDCLSNTNYLKIYANDVLIDYVSYNIQTQIPINWDNSYLENNGSIGQRIPYFKSFMIILYGKLEQVTEVTKGYIRGSVENLDSLILKDEVDLMNNLFKGGVYYEDSEKTN